MLTQEKLKELFDYNSECGIFTRLVSSGSAKKGDKAGHINKYGYVQIVIDRKIYRAHRLAWLYVHGEWPKDQLDHENHMRSDNSIGNLKPATDQSNAMNLSLSKRNKSGVLGVGWNEKRQRWAANIRVNYRLIFLGRFRNKEDAISARKKAENYYGFHINHGQAPATI